MMKPFLLLLYFFLIFSSCKTFDDPLNLEQKNDDSIEFYYGPDLTFFNGGDYNFYVEVIYQIPSGFYYLRVYPEKEQDQFEIDNAILRLDKNSTPLTVIKPKITEKQKKDKFFPVKLKSSLLKISKEDWAILMISETDSKVLINGKLNNVNKEFIFSIEQYDKVNYAKFTLKIQEWMKVYLDKKKKKEKLDEKDIKLY